MADQNLTLARNPLIIQESKQTIRMTWPNHFSNRQNCEHYFGKISQYLWIINQAAYTCILFDGSIIRTSYRFTHEDELIEHSLLWWPSPFQIERDDLILGGIIDLFHYYADNWQEEIQMRTPIRFDFDSQNASPNHPASHMHFQNSDCRLIVHGPICFNRFISFIFKNGYPKYYEHYSFLSDLDFLDLRTPLFKSS